MLGLYCWHDRLSLANRAGQGCTASNKRLCARLGWDYTTLLKLRKSLEDWGYIETTRAGGQYRREVVRVIPDHLADPAKWPFDPAYIGAAALALAAAAAMSLIAAPVVAQAAVTGQSRVGSEIEGENLRGGFIIPLIALIAIILGILAATSGDGEAPESP